MKCIYRLLTLSLGALLIVPAPVMPQEAEVSAALQRTVAALNAGQVNEFMSYVLPRTQLFFVQGAGLAEFAFDDWREWLNGHQFDLVPRRIRVQVHGNTAIIGAYIHGTVQLASGFVIGHGPWRYSETRIWHRGTWKMVQGHFSHLHGDWRAQADPRFRVLVENPAYEVGMGPVVLIDEAHFNLHTAWGRYRPFAELLREDGYVVRESSALFSPETLAPASVLVIAHAMSENLVNQQGPPLPAFTPDEVTAVRNWVHDGGSLFFVVDHNPYPASSEDLAEAFGIQLLNCGAVYPDSRSGWLMFRRLERVPEGHTIATDADSISYGSGGTLMDHAVTTGVDSVATFLGSAFEVDPPHEPLLVFGPRVECWDATDLVASVPGYLQGSLLEVGEGRVAVFGDDAMFTALRSLRSGSKRGMNNPIAARNSQLLLNVMHWLTRFDGQQ